MGRSCAGLAASLSRCCSKTSFRECLHGAMEPCSRHACSRPWAPGMLHLGSQAKQPRACSMILVRICPYPPHCCSTQVPRPLHSDRLCGAPGPRGLVERGVGVQLVQRDRLQHNRGAERRHGDTVRAGACWKHRRPFLGSCKDRLRWRSLEEPPYEAKRIGQATAWSWGCL